MWTSFKEIEKLAFDNQPLPKYHYQSEQLCYMAMRCLYHDYRLGYLDKKQAQKERKQIKLTYKQVADDEKIALTAVRRFDDLRVAMSKVNKDIELHGCELCQRMVKLMDGRLPLNENKKK